MSKKPYVSIIIPVFNAETSLRTCLNRILEQSVSDFEVILVDDGSLDNSGKICDEYASNYSNFIVHHKINEGVSKTRNVGLDLAKGEWIYFVDSDDLLEIDSIEKLIGYTKSSETDFIMAGFRIISEQGEVLENPKRIRQKIISKDEAFSELYKATDFSYQGYIWCKLFKNSIIKDSNVRFNEKIFFNEDRLFILEYLKEISKPIFYVSEPVYNYVRGESGAMCSLKKGYNKKFVTDFDAFVSMKEIIFKYTKDSELRKKAREGICESFIGNRTLMIDRNAYDWKIHMHLLKGLIVSGTFKFYLTHYILRPLVLLFLPNFSCLPKRKNR